MSWREKKREAGHRDILVWLTPEAVKALATLQASHTKATVADVVSSAIVQASTAGLALAADNQVMQSSNQLADITDAIATLTSRLDRIEAGPVTQAVTLEVETPAVAPDALDTGPRAEKAPKDASQTKKPGKGPGKDRRQKVDRDVLAAAVEERRKRDGDDYSRAELYRDLKAAGVVVHSTPQNFSHWIKHKLAP